MVNPVKAGVVLGLFLGLFHAGWAALVYLRHAQAVLDFIFRLHFITPPYHVEVFDIARAGMLVGVTAGIGLIGGIIAGVLWNVIHGA